MYDFEESRVEFAHFAFDRQKVACYGLQNTAGGSTTVLNFPSRALADAFDTAFLRDRNFEILRNEAQIICLTDYDSVMRRSGDDPRIRHLNYNREFMMGTLAHVL